MDFDTKILVTIKWAVAAFTGEIAANTVGPRKAMLVLMLLMLIDWITGFTAAWILGEVSSEKGSKGLAKKGLSILWILTIFIVDRAAHMDLNVATWITVAYCINEAVSITENMDRAGVYIPAAVVAGLQKVKGLGPRKATRAELDALRDSETKMPPGN